MCGDMNAEQYLDLKTPRGHPYVLENKQKYGHLWMVSELEQNSSRGILFLLVMSYYPLNCHSLYFCIVTHCCMRIIESSHILCHIFC